MRCALPRPLMALPLAVSLVGQSAEPALPFVGCVSYGQASKAEAPAAVSVRRTFSRHDMENLAYYQSAEIGLVAPKGWNCEGFSDSSGWGMFLSPEPIKGERRRPSFNGPAIELHHISGENGFGRWQIAEAISLVFPTFRAWAVQSMEGIGNPLPPGPYPTDRLRYRSSRVVEFETPSRRKGLSNDFSRIVPNDKPIYGVAILMGNPPGDLLVLSVRMPDEFQSLLPMVMKDIEEHRGQN